MKFFFILFLLCGLCSICISERHPFDTEYRSKFSLSHRQSQKPVTLSQRFSYGTDNKNISGIDPRNLTNVTIVESYLKVKQNKKRKNQSKTVRRKSKKSADKKIRKKSIPSQKRKIRSKSVKKTKSPKLRHLIDKKLNISNISKEGLVNSLSSNESSPLQSARSVLRDECFEDAEKKLLTIQSLIDDCNNILQEEEGEKVEKIIRKDTLKQSPKKKKHGTLFERYRKPLRYFFEKTSEPHKKGENIRNKRWILGNKSNTSSIIMDDFLYWFEKDGFVFTQTDYTPLKIGTQNILGYFIAYDKQTRELSWYNRRNHLIGSRFLTQKAEELFLKNAKFKYNHKPPIQYDFRALDELEKQDFSYFTTSQPRKKTSKKEGNYLALRSLL